MSNLKPSDRAAVVAVINPASQGAGAVSTGWIAAKDYSWFLATVAAGVLGAAATLDAKIEQATSAAGAGAKDVTGKAITQLTKAGGDDNKQALINVNQEDLDQAGGFTHIRLTLTVGVAASLVAATLAGFDAAYTPTNAAGVAEVV